MQMKYIQPVNYAAFSYNGDPVYGSGLSEHETADGGPLLTWCVGPVDTVQQGWVNYTPVSILPEARESQVEWIIESNGWAGIQAMTGVEQDALALILNEAWLENPANEMNFGSGTSIIEARGEHANTAEFWLLNSQGITSTGTVDIVILHDPNGQNQATWDVALNVPEPATILLMSIGLIVAWTVGRYLQTKPQCRHWQGK